MVQRIGLRLIDHDKKPVLDVSTGFNLVPVWKLLFDKNGNPKKEYPLLSGIDPYGHTFFNTVQMKPLIKELNFIYHEAATNEQKKTIKAVMELATNCSAKPHRYLEFLGD